MKRLDAARELSGEQDQYNSDSARCECEDFHRHSYPCKHILKHWLDGDGNLVIPPSDLDPRITAQSISSPSGTVATTTALESEPAPSEPSATTDDLMTVKLKRIRTLLDEVKSWTYLVASPNNHWLAVTNVGTTAAVRILDSLAYDPNQQALRGIASA